VDFGPSWSTGKTSMVTLARASASALRAFRPDIVYAHEMRPTMAALLGARGLPLAVCFHSLTSVEWAGYAQGAPARQAAGYRALAQRSRLAERLATRRADCIFAAAAHLAERIDTLYRPRAKPIAVPNGVEQKLLDAPVGERPAFDAGLDAAHHTVSTVPAVGSPSNERALEFLHAVSGELAGLTPRVGVHVLGRESGPEAELLRYQGFVPELQPWIGHADACLLPYPAEAALCAGARNKLLEYLGRGRRIVTTQEGLHGLEEAADWQGVYVAPHDPRAFAETVAAAVAPGAVQLDTSDEARNGLSWDVRADTVGAALRKTVEA